MIPNICHFVFGLKPQEEEFLFNYYLAVYSCFIVNNPDIIYFYYHYEPYGKWWDKLKIIPTINLQKIDVPTHIGTKIIKKTAHKADKVRMDILYEKGGIYLDIDTICIKSWKELLKEDVVLGKQIPFAGICNAIMFTKPKSQFFKLWLSQYENKFHPDGWNESSIILPFELSKQNPTLLKVEEPDVFFLPSYNETHKIFKIKYDIPKNLITLHLWESISLKYLKNIHDWSWAYKNSHTLYAKIMLQLLEKYICNDKNVF